MHHSNLLKL